MANITENHHPTREQQGHAGVSAPTSIGDNVIDTWKKQTYLNWTYEGLEGALSIEDFLHYVTTTVAEDSNHAWFRDDQIDAALTLLTSESKLSDSVFTIPTLYGQVLCSIGSGRLSPETLGEYSAAVLQGLTNPKKRWIVVPCSDGMLETHEAIRDKQRKSAVQLSQTFHAGFTGYLGEGAHWGLLVVDKERRDARFIDGLLTLKPKRKGGHKIDTMLLAGRAAGKVLCAIETILELTPCGQFATGTLKYVPQSRNNYYKGDSGSECGPYMYAMLEYTYRHGTQMLRDMEGTFSERAQSQHVTGLNFNSLQTRRDIRDRVFNTKRQMESDPLKSLRLDTSIMDILGLISPDAVLATLNRYNARLKSSHGVP
jgi:hypothetical protein